MSLTLLKNSLNVLENNTGEDKNSKTKKSASKKSECRRHRVVVKKSNNTFKPLNTSNTQEKHTKLVDDKKTKDNVRRLLALSWNVVNTPAAEKIMKHTFKDNKIKKTLPRKKEESIFTEEDFQRFEKEYLNS